MYFFGNCIDGQGGLSISDDTVNHPVVVVGSLAEAVSKVHCSAKNSYAVTSSGELYSCGNNDNNQLGRTGKKSTFNRCDAIEAFKVTDVASGDGFCICLTADGKVIAWGRNDFGQLGAGNREPKEKPRPVTFTESVLQISAGAQHAVALTTCGNVLVWGANRKGQLGDGQLTSSCVPQILPQLRHRPIVRVCCGENHTLALTVTGNLFVWGDNAHFQLGLGDEKPRLRPELLRSLRSSRVKQIAAGRYHSAIITPTGLLVAFGSNSHGQCGLNMDIRAATTPTVVERLREVCTVDVCCGLAHTVAICESPDYKTPKVFAFGLNSSGQLGTNGEMSNCAVPTQVHLPQDIIPSRVVRSFLLFLN